MARLDATARTSANARTEVSPIRLDYGEVFIRNRFFEEGVGDIAITTTTNGYIENSSFGSDLYLSAAGTATAEYDTAVKYAGSKSLKFSTLSAGAGAYVYQCTNPPVVAGGTGVLTHFEVKPSTAYVLTCQMKTEYTSGDSDRGAYIRYQGSNGKALVDAGVSPYVKTTTDWSPINIGVTTSGSSSTGIIRATIDGNYGASNLIMTVWLDNYKLMETGSARSPIA